MSVTPVSVALPTPQVDTLNEQVVAWFPGDVLAINGVVFGPQAYLSSSREASVNGAAFLAAAWWAGYRPTTAGVDRVVLPEPITPEWAEVSHAYFLLTDGHVAVHPNSGWVELNDRDALDAEHAWHKGLSLLAAGRYAFLEVQEVAA